MANTLIINNTLDLSNYVQWKVDRLEQTRKVYGPNELKDIDGTKYPDLIANKIDPGFLLRPMPDTMLRSIYAVMRQETVTVTYTSFNDANTRTIQAIPHDMQLKYACEGWDGHIYEGTAITFEEV